MTMLLGTQEEQISELIDTTIEQLDITENEFLAAERCYDDLGAHLAQANADVYVQGSFLLGTVVRPHNGVGEYDLDLVSRLDLAKTSVSQQELKDRVGTLLTEYLHDHDGVACESPGSLTSGRRAWCLHYGTFHMDVLPAIPDAGAASDSAIELTDQTLRLWRKSDPLKYVEWFREQCATEFEKQLVILAHGGSVDAVPRHRVRTPLHRVVQILKRHRDIAFSDDPGDRPPSSLITTLAARAYRGETDLLAATLNAVQRMPLHIENRNGQYWVENPACSGENFADKWNEYELRRLKFEAWRSSVERDLTSFLLETKGPALMHQRFAKAFGAAPVRDALTLLEARAATATTFSKDHPMSGDKSALTLTAGATPVTFRDTEEFIEERHPVELRYRVRIDCTVTQAGFRPTRLLHMLAAKRRLSPRKSLEFTIEECKVPKPYEVKWKVLNRGPDAKRRDNIRGQIINTSNDPTLHEVTSFRGDHLVECYIIKDGVVVARDRIHVPIDPD